MSERYSPRCSTHPTVSVVYRVAGIKIHQAYHAYNIRYSVNHSFLSPKLLLCVVSARTPIAPTISSREKRNDYPANDIGVTHGDFVWSIAYRSLPPTLGQAVLTTRRTLFTTPSRFIRQQGNCHTRTPQSPQVDPKAGCIFVASRTTQSRTPQPDPRCTISIVRAHIVPCVLEGNRSPLGMTIVLHGPLAG